MHATTLIAKISGRIERLSRQWSLSPWTGADREKLWQRCLRLQREISRLEEEAGA